MCPPQLGQLLQGNYESITALDTEVIAVSHETVAINKMLAERYGTEFLSLSDTSRETIHAYDTVDRGLNIAQITFFVVEKKASSAGAHGCMATSIQMTFHQLKTYSTRSC